MTTKIYDLVLTNGQCLLPHPSGTGFKNEKTNIAIKDGKIAAIGTNIHADQGAEHQDLNHLHVLPGIIDSQVHFREPGLTHKEDLESGTRAAILGGVTSIFEMPNTNPSTTTAADFQQKLDLAKNRAHCNYAFFIGGSADNSKNINELEKLAHCSGVKIFMGSSTGNLLVDQDLVLEEILANGYRRVIVHSEDEARLKERKHIAIDSKDVHNHHIWRDVETAMISTKKLISFARKYNRNVHVLHVSTAEEMDFLKNQKDIASVEVLPQHLTLFAPDCYDRLGTFAQQNPPIREKRHLERLWQAIADGTVDIIGSDHAPHTREEKNKPYPSSPSGVPGVQTLVPIMLNHVFNQRLSLERFLEMVTTNPVKIFGVKNKGSLKIGFDADITVVDLKAERTIENKMMATKCGWTPFDGMKVHGWATHTIVDGKIVMMNDQVIKPSTGQAIEFNI